MRKIWAIAYINTYQTFTDRNLILIMIVTPLLLATIISLAFGGSGSTAIRDIPVAIVNLDAGAEATGGIQNYGTIFVSAFVPPSAEAEAAASEQAQGEACPLLPAESTGAAEAAASLSLYDLTDAVELTDPAAAKAGVDQGDYAAAIIIPANFSQSIAFSPLNPTLNPVPVEVYGDSGQAVLAGIVRGIVEGITNQIMTGQISVAATIQTMIARNPLGAMQLNSAEAGAQIGPVFGCAFAPGFNPITLNSQTVTGQQSTFDPLVAIGSAQAVFFALFTASATAATILEERRNGTLQRMIISPTSRVTIMLGKLLGVFLTVLLQLVFLFIGFTVIGSILRGGVTFIWGTDWIALVLLLLTTSLATSGVGMVAAAVGRTVEQANIIGSIVSMLMGILGGAFFSVQALGNFEWVTRISVVRWGSEGFSRLASGQGEIGLNIVFLAALGGLFFVIGLVAFNRRQDV